MNSSRPSEARDRVLAQFPAEKQVEIMQRAEKRGPRPDDPDWLLVETMMTCAARMESASGHAAIAAQLERIESRLNRYADSRGTFAMPTETERTDIRAQLDRIEARLGAPPPKMPSLIVPTRTRDLMIFASAILLCVAGAAAVGAAAVPFVVLIAAFALGLCAALAYCWLAAMFSSGK